VAQGPGEGRSITRTGSCQMEASSNRKPLGDCTLATCPTDVVGRAGCDSRPMDSDGGRGGAPSSAFRCSEEDSLTAPIARTSCAETSVRARLLKF